AVIEADEAVVGIVAAQDTAEIGFGGQAVDRFHLIDGVDVAENSGIVEGRFAASLGLVVGVDKAAIPFERTADGGTELVLAQSMSSIRLQQVRGVHGVVAEIFVERAVPVVGAAAGDDVDDASGGAAEFDGV